MRNRAQLVAAALVVFLCTFAIPPVVLADQGDELQSKLNQSQGRFEDMLSQLSASKEQKNALVEQVKEIDQKIAATNQEINRLSGDLDKTIAQRSRVEAELTSLTTALLNTVVELEKAKKRLVVEKKSLNRRARGIYVNGRIATLSVLLNSSSFGDFVNRFSFLEKVAGSDARLVRRITATKAEIAARAKLQEEQKTSIDNKRVALVQEEQRISGLREEQQQQKTALESDKTSRQTLVARLGQDQAALQAAAVDEEATSQKIAANLDAWRAEAARARAEAEAKAKAEAEASARAEEEARSAANSSSSSRGSDRGMSPSEPAPAPEPALPSTPPPPAPAPEWVWPSGSMADITSYFGWRYAPTAGASSYHEGVDVGVDYGTPVHAAHSGTVIYAGHYGGFGNFVLIDHGDGISSSYAHLDYPVVSVGQWVEAGQLIAYSGSTGVSTGPHLDFRIYVDGNAQNPLNWY